MRNVVQNLIGEIADAEAGRLRTGQGSAVGQALAGDDAAVKTVDDLFVLSEKIADFPRSDADVAGRGIGKLPDMPVQLRHEALAEAHHFRVGFSLGVEVGAALAAAHGQRGQGVLQDLLESKEFNDGQVDRRMEAKAALVGTDGGVELHAVAAVDTDLSAVIHPGNAEHDHTLRLREAFHQACLFPFRMFRNDQLKALKNLVHRLQEFRLVAIPLLQIGIHSLKILVCYHTISPFLRAYSYFSLISCDISHLLPKVM